MITNGCYKCLTLAELYKQVPQSNRNYWLMTELVFFLHGDSDVCNPRSQLSESDVTQPRCITAVCPKCGETFTELVDGGTSHVEAKC